MDFTPALSRENLPTVFQKSSLFLDFFITLFCVDVIYGSPLPEDENDSSNSACFNKIARK